MKKCNLIAGSCVTAMSAMMLSMVMSGCTFTQEKDDYAFSGSSKIVEFSSDMVFDGS